MTVVMLGLAAYAVLFVVVVWAPLAAAKSGGE